MNERPSIFKYDSLSDYLTQLGTGLARGGKQPTLRTWARRLGYRSPRTIGMILKGDRSPSQQFVERVSQVFGLTVKEHRYLELLSYSKKTPGQTRLREEMKALQPLVSPKRVLTAGEVRYLSHWYHLAIKQLVQLKDFDPDPEVIAKRLGEKLTPAQVVASLKRMEELGILVKTDDGSGYRVAEIDVTTTTDRPDPVIRMHHREQMLRAHRKLERVPVEKREFNTLTLGFDVSKTQAAKKFIREFMDEFDRRFYTRETNQVYQLNVQFFPQTGDET